MAKSFGIYSKKVDTDDGDYTMDHTASVLLLNAKGEFAGTIAYGEKRRDGDRQAEAPGGRRLT